MADETFKHEVVQVIPSSPNSSPPIVANSALTNGSPPVTPSPGLQRPKPAGNSQAVQAILSRAGVDKSEGLLRTIADTPPTAPASPRLFP